MSLRMHVNFIAGAVALALLASGCSSNNSPTPATSGAVAPMHQGNGQGENGQGGNGQGENGQGGNGQGHGGKSILKQLKMQVVIGSTIDGAYGQLNPYGLDVAKSTSGAFTKGDLAVANFNDNQNVQGTGFTIVALHPKPGSTPTLVTSDPTRLLGPTALALTSDDTMFVAAFAANDNPVLSSSGSLITNLSGSPFNNPFGEVYAPGRHDADGKKGGNDVVYESNAGDGNIIRINIGGSYSSEVIATGFPVNGGPPGSILGPSGLQYDGQHDTLYVVDGDNNSVTTISKVSSLHGGCLRVMAHGHKFAGPCGSKARILYEGAPLNGPISSALLFNDSIVVGNTLDPSGSNLMVEIGKNGKVLDVADVDTGAAGALFGMVATGTNAGNTKLYFNDDNDNNLQVLER
ncbi:MAG TPA: hypothetical protein VGI19_14495 [Candidatus Cybelea sp.]